MLNSLYGRWGLKFIKTVTEIVTTETAKELSLKYEILENVKFNEEKNLEYIKYNIKPNDPLYYIDEDMYFDIKHRGEKDVDLVVRSVGILAMTTSYAITYMYKYLKIPNNKVFYTIAVFRKNVRF